MAVTVGADNNRIAVATIATDSGTWGNDGGGGGVADEPDFFYQGSGAQSRKVSTSRIGRSYDAASTVNAQTTDRTTFLFKVNITNYAALLTRTSPAAGIKIGSSSSAYYEYYVLGSDNYPAVGGWQFIAIDPNVSGYRDATQGSPSLTAVDYYSLLADFSATSKGENVVIDAIDQGAGLYLTGGTPDGDYDDFVAHDEGTVGNRYGYVHTKDGVIYVQGELAIGENASETAVATQFTDDGRTLVYGNGWVATGFYRHRVNLGNASTTFDVTNMTYTSIGEDNNTVGLGYTTTEDTRLVFEFIGTSGAATMDGCVFQNLASFDLTSVVAVTGCTIECELLTQGSADISESTIITTSASGVATLQDPTFGTTTDLHDVEFVQNGAGHALEIDSAGTYDLNNFTWTGYNASDGNNDSAIYVSAGSGTVTLNIIGGTTPSVRSAGATIVKVINPVTLTVTALDAADASPVAGARVYARVSSDTADLPYQRAVTLTAAGGTATATLGTGTHTMAVNDWVRVYGATDNAYNGLHQITGVTSTTFQYAVSGTPSSDSGNCIAVLINATTNGSGVATFTRSYNNDQPFTGWVRKGTTSPLYKQSPLNGTVDKDTGATATVALVGDEG